MKDGYIIINKTALQNRIDELEKAILLCKPEQQLIKDFLEQELFIRREILSQSTPLIPELEKTFEAARERIKHPDWDYIYEEFEEYISNLEF